MVTIESVNNASVVCVRMNFVIVMVDFVMVTVVMQVLMQMMELLPQDGAFMNTLIRKLAPPLGK